MGSIFFIGILVAGLVFLMWKSQQLQQIILDRKQVEDDSGKLGEMLQSHIQQSWQQAAALFRAKPLLQVEPIVFSAWVKQSVITDVATEAWVAALEEDELAVVARFSADYCDNLGFNLNWLINGTLPDELDETLTRVVTRYLESCYMTFTVRKEIQAYGASSPHDK